MEVLSPFKSSNLKNSFNKSYNDVNVDATNSIIFKSSIGKENRQNFKESVIKESK